MKKILPECNYLENLLYKIYTGEEEFTTNNWRKIQVTLNNIRSEVIEKQEDEGDETTNPRP